MNKLDLEQEELLTLLVEAERSVPRDERHPFTIRRTISRNPGVELRHAGWNRARRVFEGDIELLAQGGFINFTQSTPASFYVTPLGFEHYHYLTRRQVEPLRRVEERVTATLSGSWFRSRYPTAYQKWCEAEALLTSDASDVTATVVGHLTREAMQEFAEAVVRRLEVADAPPDKTHTLRRIRAALEARRPPISKTTADALGALYTYWESVNNVIQRQEHGAAKEGERLTWADSRRVVFLLAVVFFELDAALES